MINGQEADSFFDQQLARLNADRGDYLDELEDYKQNIEDIHAKTGEIFKKLMVKNTAIHKCNLYSAEMEKLNGELEAINRMVESKVKTNKSLEAQAKMVEGTYSKEQYEALERVKELKAEVEGLKEHTNVLKGEYEKNAFTEGKRSALGFEVQRLRTQNQQKVEQLQELSTEVCAKEERVAENEKVIEQLDLRIKHEKEVVYNYIRGQEDAGDGHREKAGSFTELLDGFDSAEKDICSQIALQKNKNLTYVEEAGYYEEMANSLMKKTTAMRLLKQLNYRQDNHAMTAACKKEAEKLQDDIEALNKRLAELNGLIEDTNQRDIRFLNDPRFESEVFLEDFRFEYSLQTIEDEVNSELESLSKI